jgi:F-type H+-transporting ATPase subunit b
MLEWLQHAEFWVGVGFVVVLAFFAYKGIPRMIGSALDARAAAIAKELDEAKRLREEAQALLAQYRSKAANADQEAEAIIVAARAEAERFAADSRVALAAQIERRAKAAQEKIAQAEAQAVAEVRALAADAAVAAAEKLIAARMTDDRARALIQGAVREIPGKLN